MYDRIVWAWVKKARAIDNLNYLSKSWLLFDVLSGNITTTAQRRDTCLEFLSELKQTQEVEAIIAEIQKNI